MGAGNHLRWEEHAQLRANMDAVVAGISECRAPNGFIMGFNESELATDEHPDYTRKYFRNRPHHSPPPPTLPNPVGIVPGGPSAVSWTTHGLLAAHRAGNTQALPLIRGMLNLFNNHTQLPLFLPPDGGDPPYATPEVFPPPFPGWDNVTNQGMSLPHGHAIYLIYQGLIHQTQMALSEAGTQADVDLVQRMYEEDWWLQQLAARDPGAVWHRQYWSHNYELTAIEAYLDMFVLTGGAKYLDAVMGAWEMWRESFLHLGGSVAINEVQYYYPGSYYLTADFIQAGWHARAERRGLHPHLHGHYSHGRDHGHGHGHGHGLSDDGGNHPTGEFCGASFGQRLNQRLHRLYPDNETFVLEIEREVLNEAPAHQGALMPKPALAGGEFIVATGGDGRVWWNRNESGVKNFLQVCEPCRGTTINGCSSVHYVSQAYVDSLAEGPFFTCSMLPPDPSGGQITDGIRYYSNLNGVKQSPYNIGTCCEGQGSRLYASLHEFIFSVPADAAAPAAVYVDLYAAADVTVSVPGANVTVAVATHFPYGEGVSITVTASAAARLDLALRIPAWVAAASVAVLVGGARWPSDGAPGSYLHVSREWAEGATAVEFALPMALAAHLYAGDTQAPPFARYAFTFGPVMLAAVGALDATLNAVAIADVDPTAPASWLVPRGNLTFAVAGNAAVVFIPYGSIYGETFSVYPVFLAAPLPPAVAEVAVSWETVLATTPAIATYLDQVNPSMAPTSAVHDAVFARVAELNASMVRYLHWDPFPAISYPAPAAPACGGAGASWNFSLIDPLVRDFMDASGCGARPAGCVFSFSPLPAWMLDGSGPRDHSGAEAGEYFSRIVSWYTKGGFVDECGATHASSFRYRFAIWEVLNEVDYGSPIQCPSPTLPGCAANYTRVYDGIVRVLRRDHPELAFSALALAMEPPEEDFWWRYFLDAANHADDYSPPEWTTFHYYALPAGAADELSWSSQVRQSAAAWIARVADIKGIVSLLSPTSKVSVNEIGFIPSGEYAARRRRAAAPAAPPTLPGDACPPMAALYGAGTARWVFNVHAVHFAAVFGGLAALGVESMAASQLTAYDAGLFNDTLYNPTDFPNFPCISMLSPFSGGGTARFHVLRALVAALGDGPKQVARAGVSGGAAFGPCAGGAQQGGAALFAHAFAVQATGARVLLLGNWCAQGAVVAALGAAGAGASVTMVNATAGTDTAPPAVFVAAADGAVELGPLAVAVVVLAGA
jgi:hypothetical protein